MQSNLNYVGEQEEGVMRKNNVLLVLGCVGVAFSAQAQEVQHPVSGHYYRYLPFTISADIWGALQADAVGLGGNLVTIRSAEENQWIVDTFAPLTSDGSVYIGFNDIAMEGTFEWVSGEPVPYTNWNGGEPNDSGGEDVAELFMTTGLWNDIPSVDFQGAIMERIVFEFRIKPAGGGFVEEGSDVVFTGDAWGTSSPITYQWKKDGAPLGGETSTTLTLLSVTSADNGSYTLEASDSSKAIIVSTPVSITVVTPGSLPVGGAVALSIAVGCAALGGVFRLRRRRNR